MLRIFMPELFCKTPLWSKLHRCSLSLGGAAPSAAPDYARAGGHGAADSFLVLSGGGRRGRAMGSASPTAGLQQHGEGLRTRSRSAFSWPGRWRARLNLLMRVSLVNRSFRHASRGRGGGAESGPSFGPGRPPPISIWLDRGRRALTGGVSSGPLAAAAPS